MAQPKISLDNTVLEFALAMPQAGRRDFVSLTIARDCPARDVISAEEIGADLHERIKARHPRQFPSLALDEACAS
jgi:hypothetical protein